MTNNASGRSWVMYRRKPKAPALILDIGGEVKVRYSVLCEGSEAKPVLFSGTELIPHSAEADDPSEARKFVHIASPRNVRFAPEDMDQDPRQWSRTAMPAERFLEIYEPAGAQSG